jgi:hypothetical protein
MLIIPGFPSGKFIQPSPFPLAVSYILSKGKPRQRPGPDKKTRTEPLGGTNLFPPDNAATKPRSIQIARNALRFPEKSRYNKSVYKLRSNDVASKGPMTPDEKQKEVTHTMKNQMKERPAP